MKLNIILTEEENKELQEIADSLDISVIELLELLLKIEDWNFKRQETKRTYWSSANSYLYIYN